VAHLRYQVPGFTIYHASHSSAPTQTGQPAAAPASVTV
jgi:hypothetical protein